MAKSFLESFNACVECGRGVELFRWSGLGRIRGSDACGIGYNYVRNIT